MAHNPLLLPPPGALLQAFDIADKDGKGTLSLRMGSGGLRAFCFPHPAGGAGAQPTRTQNPAALCA